MQPEPSGVSERNEIIGVVGVGVVGGALCEYLRSVSRDVRIYDPAQGHDGRGALEVADTVFVCVPTPYTPGTGFDDSFLLAAMASIEGSKTVVIKSTVLPGTTDLIQGRFPQHRMLFNPEFLREATANEDFIAPDRQIVGHTERSRDEAARVMAMLPPAPFELICTAAEAEMAKYAANAFLAVKVSYANEVFDLCRRLGIDYAPVRDIVGADVRIGASHLDVMDSGYRGYGGKCLPKDSKALLDLAKASGVPLEVLRAADHVNALLRREGALPSLVRIDRNGDAADAAGHRAA
jgi:UDPglucose 6-dehydrogenase